MSKTVLVVEDDGFHHKRWQRALGDDVVLLSAFSIPQAEQLFLENPNPDAIVMDACVPGDKPTTIPLVKAIRIHFSGPIIAASADPKFREMLMAVGCDHQSNKDMLPDKLRVVLGL